MAVPVTVKQMALTRDVGPGGFMDRVVAMLASVASGILNEAGTTPHHSGRAAYAQRVVQSPSSQATIGAPQIVMGVNIVVTTTYDEATKTSTCTATDQELESQVLTLWNSLAGLDTPA
jgi:hypothetical protein